MNDPEQPANQIIVEFKDAATFQQYEQMLERLVGATEESR